MKKKLLKKLLITELVNYSIKSDKSQEEMVCIDAKGDSLVVGSIYQRYNNSPVKNTKEEQLWMSETTFSCAICKKAFHKQRKTTTQASCDARPPGMSFVRRRTSCLVIMLGRHWQTRYCSFRLTEKTSASHWCFSICCCTVDWQAQKDQVSFVKRTKEVYFHVTTALSRWFICRHQDDSKPTATLASCEARPTDTAFLWRAYAVILIKTLEGMNACS